jgi:hypothetical protein
VSPAYGETTKDNQMMAGDKKIRLQRNSSLRRRLYRKQDSKVGASSRHWRSVARDYWRSLHKRGELRLPLSTAASCRPALREVFLTASRTMLTTGVSRNLRSHSVTAVTRVWTIFHRSGEHILLAVTCDCRRIDKGRPRPGKSCFTGCGTRRQ